MSRPFKPTAREYERPNPIRPERSPFDWAGTHAVGILTVAGACEGFLGVVNLGFYLYNGHTVNGVLALVCAVLAAGILQARRRIRLRRKVGFELKVLGLRQLHVGHYVLSRKWVRGERAHWSIRRDGA